MQRKDNEKLDWDVLPELTVNVIERVGGGKNYVLRNVQVGTISSNFAFRQFAVREFGKKVCGTAKHLHIGYLKGNKHVWMRTGDGYLEILENSVMGARLLYSVSVARKPLGKDELPMSSLIQTVVKLRKLNRNDRRSLCLKKRMHVYKRS